MAFAKCLRVHKPLLLPTYDEIFVFYPLHDHVQIVVSEVFCKELFPVRFESEMVVTYTYDIIDDM